jgi:hypothetical protein
LLSMAEGLLRRGIAITPRSSEMSALCKFELGNVLCLQYQQEQAIPFYQESIDGTNEPSNKGQRSLRMVEALKVLKNYAGAKAILTGLVNSPNKEVAESAKRDLQAVEAALTATPK